MAGRPQLERVRRLFRGCLPRCNFQGIYAERDALELNEELSGIPKGGPEVPQKRRGQRGLLAAARDQDENAQNRLERVDHQNGRVSDLQGHRLRVHVPTEEPR